MATRRAQSLPAVAALVFAISAGAIVLVRLPAAFHGFSSAAAAQAGRNELDGALATADSVGINDNFIRAAFQYIPIRARFVVALPTNLTHAEQAYGINPISFDALPSMLEDFMLPRQEVVRPRLGTYIVCYFCESPYWDHRTRWLWKDGAGAFIGKWSAR